MKVRLMFRDRDVDPHQLVPGNREDVIQDLNLSTLLNAMAAGDDFLFDVAQRALLSSLDQPDEIVYRQQVLLDGMAHAEIIREIYDIAVGAINAEKRVFWGFFRNRPEHVLHRSIEVLQLLLEPLRRLRKIAEENAQSVTSDGLATLFTMLRSELNDEYFDEVADHLKQLKFRRGLLVSAQLTSANKGTNYVLRTPGRTTQSWKQWLGLEAKSSYSFEIAARDEAGADAISELRDRGLDPAANALAQSTDHILSFFTMIRSELGFYLGAINLAEALRAGDHPTCVPTPVEWGSNVASAAGLYDVSLALRDRGRMVGNRLDADGKSLVVITGANSGGKSTFLRAVGLAQLMMQCGLFVPADSFRAGVYDAVFTHFIREEDASMESGRLDDELSRMSDIADQLTSHSLLLFNESFAATNEREGSEIARQIIRALTELGVRVFIVTHLFDLANGFYHLESNKVLFLRAERESDGQRPFQLVERPPLSTSYGEDLYRRLGAWDALSPAADTRNTPELSSP